MIAVATPHSALHCTDRTVFDRGGIVARIGAEPSLALRSLWKALGEHLGGTLRLRRSLATIEPDAIYHSDGRCAHAGAGLPATMRERLRQHVLERERLRLRGDDVGRMVASWSAVTQHGWTVLDRFDSDGRRWIVAWDNPLRELDPRHLDDRERDVLRRAIEGWSNRETAEALELSGAATSRSLRGALRKLGTRDLGELSRWRSLESAGELLALPLGIEGLRAIGVPSMLAEAVDRLTPSERAIVPQLLSGLRNREIAEVRGTSDRTIANQVRAIFDKLGVGSRRELAQRLSGRISPR